MSYVKYPFARVLLLESNTSYSACIKTIVIVVCYRTKCTVYYDNIPLRRPCFFLPLAIFFFFLQIYTVYTLRTCVADF